MSSFSRVNLHNVVNKHDLIEAFFLRGQSLIQLDKFNEAYVSFQRVLTVDPTYSQAYYYQGIARYHLNHSKCIQDFNRALSLNPESFEPFLARACIYGIQGRYAKAVLNCNKAISLNPKSVRSYLYRGALKFLLKSYRHAISDLSDAIKLDQACTLAYYNRALCYHHLKENNDALKDYSVVLMLGDYLKYQTCINRALLYYELKDIPNALRDFQMALEFTPDDLNIQHVIATCYHK